MIRVVLADDQALLRGTFRLLLDSIADIEVVGEASDGAEAVSITARTAVDVLVMDIRMPVMDGIEATRRITEDTALGGLKVLILTTFETEDLVVDAFRAGASGFIGKGVDPAQLIDAIRTVAAGDALLSAAASAAMIKRVLAQTDTSNSRNDKALAQLTVREREITGLVAQGLSNEEIAERLFISPATAKTHVNRSMTKTGSRDRAQLVVFAYQNAIVKA